MTITVINRMKFGAGGLAMLDEAASKSGMSRDDYIAMATVLYALADLEVRKIKPASKRAPRNAGELLADAVIVFRGEKPPASASDAINGLGGWGS